LGDLKPKKKKRKKRKKSPPKPRSAIDVAKNPKPYQFNLYTPPFPSVIYHQPKANAISQNVANTFRNIQAVNAKELERLRGDFTAYRQESQTIFKKLVAFPRERAMPEERIEEPIEEPIESPDEKTLMEQAGKGAGRLTEPETKISLPPRNPEDELPSRRKYQRKNKSMAMLKRELQSENISFPSKIKAKELRLLAQNNGISIQL
tara:strand:+ start:221 stop:835 length:615 start_codon:yes stop_codon:yes gene_type:complete